MTLKKPFLELEAKFFYLRLIPQCSIAARSSFFRCISFYSSSSLGLPKLFDRFMFMVLRISVLVFVNLIESGMWNPVHPVSQFHFVLLPVLAVIVINSLIRSETWTPCTTVSLLPRDKVNLGLSWSLLSNIS